jgi:predicted nucleic acid-binding protein
MTSVLVDTPVWSLAFRRKQASHGPGESQVVQVLLELISNGRAQLPGPVRQELLSGIRDPAQFQRIRLRLRAFEDVPLNTEDYEKAGECSNLCRSHGIAKAPIDMLLCAIALRRGWEIFSLDKDFERYAEVLDLKLHPVASR